MAAPAKTPNTLRLTPKRSSEAPEGFRFVDRRGRYILQERVAYLDAPGGYWRDVPFVGSESAAAVVLP